MLSHWWIQDSADGDANLIVSPISPKNAWHWRKLDSEEGTPGPPPGFADG